MLCLKQLSGEQLAVLASVVASIIASERDAEENNLLAEFIVTVGDSLSLIAARQEMDIKK